MTLYEFLDAVAANNNRPWFAAHRAEYDELRAKWLADLERVIAAMAAWDPAMARTSAKESTYRFYRDTRFSPDKSPFKTYFSAALSPLGRKSGLASFYLQLDSRAEENGIYAGLWMPDAAMLKKMRHAIVDNIEEWEEILAEKSFKKHWPEWVCSAEPLKTAPAGWPKAHPQIAYLRLRDYGRFCRCDRKFFEDPSWPDAAAERMRAAKPLIDFINYTLTEE